MYQDMKKVFFTMLCAGVIGLVSAQPAGQPAQPVPAPVAPVATSKAQIKIEVLAHNFGSIIEGQIARYDFKFTNTGTEDLVLTNVQASCGCTTPKWPREPLKPGATAIITAEYNSNGRPGTFTKNIFVYSNGGDATLTITGNVIKEPEKPKSPVIIKG
jgi:hypothetical protein